MIQTTLKKEVLSNYLSDVFIESGSANCSGVQLALDVGFKEIYSIEIDPILQEQNRQRFAAFPDVHLITGDSLIEMRKLLESVDLKDKTVTFFCDGHSDFGPVGVKRCPLYEELEAFKGIKIKNLRILVDDRRIWNQPGSTWGEGISEEKIKEILLEINPSFKFTYEDGWVQQDILAAY